MTLATNSRSFLQLPEASFGEVFKTFFETNLTIFGTIFETCGSSMRFLCTRIYVPGFSQVIVTLAMNGRYFLQLTEANF